jgi:N-formylglutamate deformylase
MSRLDRLSIRRSEDHFVDELFSGVVQLGAPLLAALFPRAWLDVNREPYELDPRMFDGPLPPFANIGSMRVAGGLGTIPRLVAENMDIYRGRLSVEEGLSRIERVYRPYHASLRKMIAQTHVQFGKAILIDCHSMPANVRVAGGSRRPDIIIGDRYGASAAHDLSRAAVVSVRTRLSRRSQQTLCRRVHHRALRAPFTWSACTADRDEPWSLRQ